MADQDVADLQRKLADLSARVAALEAVIKSNGISVSIVSPGMLTISAGANLEVVAGANASYVCGAGLAVTAGSNASYSIGASYAMTVGSSGNVEFGNAFKLSAATSVKFASDHGMAFAAKDLAVTAGGAVALSAKTVDVRTHRQTTRADREFSIHTRDFLVDAAGKATIKASGDVVVKGAKIAQN